MLALQTCEHVKCRIQHPDVSSAMTSTRPNQFQIQLARDSSFNTVSGLPRIGSSQFFSQRLAVHACWDSSTKQTRRSSIALVVTSFRDKHPTHVRITDQAVFHAKQSMLSQHRDSHSTIQRFGTHSRELNLSACASFIRSFAISCEDEIRLNSHASMSTRFLIT